MSWKIIVDMENCPYLGIELCSHVDSSQYCNESTCPLKDLREVDKVHISRELVGKVINELEDSVCYEENSVKQALVRDLKEVKEQ